MSLQISPGEVGKLSGLVSGGSGYSGVETLVLDGIKLAGSTAIQDLLGTSPLIPPYSFPVDKNRSATASGPMKGGLSV